MGMIEELIDTFLETDYENGNDEIINRLNGLQYEAQPDNEALFDSLIEDWNLGKYHD